MSAQLDHRIRKFAAGLILARWHVQGARSVRLVDGALEPESCAPGAGAWHVTDPAAAGALVATVLLGARYAGWDRAVATARAELAREAA